MGKIKTRKFLRDNLRYLYEKGHGTPKDNKSVHNSTPYIHSHNTYKSYLKACNRFSDWATEKRLTDPQEALKSVPTYLQGMVAEGKSAWTISQAQCAIAKAYGISTLDIPFEAPKRERAAVKRSRYAAVRDSHISASNAEIQRQLRFARATGLRRHELEKVTGNALRQDKNGHLYIFTKGKGGKERYAAVNPEEYEFVAKQCRQAGKAKVFVGGISSNLDIHGQRALYAGDMYQKIARDLNQLETNQKYFCRKDKAGCVYDRKAMLQVSRWLGHNRIDVIANSYLHTIS